MEYSATVWLFNAFKGRFSFDFFGTPRSGVAPASVCREHHRRDQLAWQVWRFKDVKSPRDEHPKSVVLKKSQTWE